jgi:hypothetical protein
VDSDHLGSDPDLDFGHVDSNQLDSTNQWRRQNFASGGHGKPNVERPAID